MKTLISLSTLSRSKFEVRIDKAIAGINEFGTADSEIIDGVSVEASGNGKFNLVLYYDAHYAELQDSIIDKTIPIKDGADAYAKLKKFEVDLIAKAAVRLKANYEKQLALVNKGLGIID